MSNFSRLYDEKTFYKAFRQDLDLCESEVIIESPYITCERMKSLKSIFERLISRKLKIYVITRDPREHEENLAKQAECEIKYFERLGVQVLICTGNHHRKLAILDRKILWEGSLNILSQSKSREIMRRIENKEIALEIFNFLNFGKII